MEMYLVEIGYRLAVVFLIIRFMAKRSSVDVTETQIDHEKDVIKFKKGCSILGVNAKQIFLLNRA